MRQSLAAVMSGRRIWLLAIVNALLIASPVLAQERPKALFPWLQLFQLGGSPTSYREDSAHVSGHYGNLIFAVRNDAGTSLCGTTGDYCPFQVDSTGQVRVVAAQGGAPWSVTGSGTFTVAGTVAQGNQGTHGQRWMVGISDGSGFISPATDRTTAASPFSFRLSDGSAFYSTNTAAQLPAALDGSGFLKVHEQGTAGVDSELPAAGALADAAANPTTPTVGAGNLLYNGATWDRMRGDTTNGLDVDVTRLPALPAGNNNVGDVDVVTLPAVTNAGTFAVQDSEKVADNAAFTDGTTKVLPSGYIFDEVAGTALTENDAAAARIDSKRAQAVVLEDETTRGRRLTITAANAAKVDGSGVTQPISAASLPLPTGAATLAEQQTQTTALQLVDNLPNTQGSTTSGQSGLLDMGAVTTAAPSYTTAQTSPLSLTTAGGLRQDIASYGGTATTLGQKTMAASEPVVMSSDQTAAGANGANLNVTGTLSVACADPCAVGSETASNTVKLATAGLRGFGMVLQSGTFTGLLRFEESVDNVNFTPLTVVGGGTTLLDRNTTITNPGAGTYAAPLTLLVSGPGGGVQFIRVRAHTLSAGTLTVFISGSSALDLYNVNLPGQGWEGTQRPTRFNIMGGVDESTACNGAACNRALVMANTTPTTTDYGAVTRDVVVAATASLITLAAPTVGLQVMGRDTGTSCSGGPCNRGFNMLNTTPVGTEYGLITRSTDGKAEDAAAVSGDVGGFQLGVRKDTNAQTTSADGDYAQFSVDAYGVPFNRLDHPNRIRCTVTTSTAVVITALGGSCAAPGAGLSIYITDIDFSSSANGIAADAFPTLKYGTGGTCGTGTTVFWGKLTAAAYAADGDHMTTPIKIPANNEVCWITTTAGSKFITIQGFIAP